MLHSWLMEGVIHLEGLPGSGKTFASERLCALFREQGVQAEWVLEERADHPVMSTALRRGSVHEGFADTCLEAWSAFLAADPGLTIFDGYALQSTVRFLFASGADENSIGRYFQSWQDISPEHSVIVFLAVLNPCEHLLATSEARGETWTGKLISYVERTEIGQQSGWRGQAGYVEFWCRYHELCRRLLHRSRLPVRFLEARAWSEAELLAAVSW